jgi:hypothetical protein
MDPLNARSPGLTALRRAARELARERGVDWRSLFEDLGLFLLDPPARSYYDVTPHDSLTFAYTGGDGVHFGVLCGVLGAGPDADADDGPVVMTVPAARVKHVVLAESVAEFLALGAVEGWFGLERLAYTPAAVYARHAVAGAPDPEVAELLRKLGLGPARLDARRVDALGRRYGPAAER